MDRLDYLLLDLPIGHAIFKVVRQVDGISSESDSSFKDLALFSKMVKLINFTALEGSLPNYHLDFEAIKNHKQLPTAITNIIDLCFPQMGGRKKDQIYLGIPENYLAAAVKAKYPGFSCPTPRSSVLAAKFYRGLRTHYLHFIGETTKEEFFTFALVSATHSSRARIKYSKTTGDKFIMAGSTTVEVMDKIINQLCMRLRDLYGAHFPELFKYVSDNKLYPRLILAIGDKNTLNPESHRLLAPLVGGDETLAESIVRAAQYSVGADISEQDLDEIKSMATSLITQMDSRQSLVQYLDSKLGTTAPNLQALIGTTMSAKLIQKAGSLQMLAEKASSTLQILGAEKALFRAMRTKTSTPKYGLLFESGAVSKVEPKYKGRIARYLANKCSLAARIDNFSPHNPTSKFGLAFRKQVEGRINFLTTRETQPSNSEVMRQTMMLVDDDFDDDTAKPTKEKRKDRKGNFAKQEEVPANSLNGNAPKPPKADKDNNIFDKDKVIKKMKDEEPKIKPEDGEGDPRKREKKQKKDKALKTEKADVKLEETKVNFEQDKGDKRKREKKNKKDKAIKREKAEEGTEEVNIEQDGGETRKRKREIDHQVHGEGRHAPIVKKSKRKSSS